MTREERGSFRSERTGPPVGCRPLSTAPVTPVPSGPTRLAGSVCVQSDSDPITSCVCVCVLIVRTRSINRAVTRPSFAFFSQRNQHAVLPVHFLLSGEKAVEKSEKHYLLIGVSFQFLSILHIMTENSSSAAQSSTSNSSGSSLALQLFYENVLGKVFLDAILKSLAGRLLVSGDPENLIRGSLQPSLGSQIRPIRPHVV